VSGRLRIALIASSRYSVQQPFVGGLEAHTWLLAQGLRRRGHEVTLFAAGSDAGLAVARRDSRSPTLSPAARSDVSMKSDDFLSEHHAYLDFMLELSGPAGAAFDVIHNNSIHYLPVAMARAARAPMVTTLHTPPTPWLESAIQIAPCPVTFVAVSAHTAQAWQHAVPDPVLIHNGVDTAEWTPGPGGGPLIWFGRLVPEKGPHLAIAAARRAGLDLDLVGPRLDEDYFRTRIEPALGPGIRYLGHLDHAALAHRVSLASASLVTPCWDEPYGLVVAESLACGTPVAGFARGALPEIVDPTCGVLVEPGNVEALATAAGAAVAMSRTAARRRAQTHCSLDRMLDGYEALYERLSTQVAA
jgi:glycosyltransferase involved in cell wall biosynthesis